MHGFQLERGLTPTPVTAMGVTVNRERALALAKRARAVPIRLSHFLPSAPEGVGAEDVVRAWFVLVGICQQTRTLEGLVGGRWMRGSDYLFAKGFEKLGVEPWFFAPAALRSFTAEQLRAWLSDDGTGVGSTVDRIEERVSLVRAIGDFIGREADDQTYRLYERAEGRIGGNGGLLHLLAHCPAYGDPVAKKSHLLLTYLNALGLWKLADPESLRLPVDYHVMRVLLRAGVVAVAEGAARTRLAESASSPDPAMESAVREASMEAGRIMVAEGGCDVMALDALLWMIGRNCCFYEHEPKCNERAAGRACDWRVRCSLLDGFAFDCQDACPLNGVCVGSGDAAYRALREPSTHSHYY